MRVLCSCVANLWRWYCGLRCCNSCGLWFGWPVKYWTAGEPLCSMGCWASSQPIGRRKSKAIVAAVQLRTSDTAHNATVGRIIQGEAGSSH